MSEVHKLLSKSRKKLLDLTCSFYIKYMYKKIK